MPTSRSLGIACLIAAAVGVVSTFVVWHLDGHTKYLGFPCPIGVVVVLPDGESDCGSGWIGWVLNPLVYVAVTLTCFGVARLLRHARRSTS